MRSITASCVVNADHIISIMSSKLGAAFCSQTVPDRVGGCHRVRCGS